MSDKYHKVEDRPDLIKDTDTGAILNTSLTALEAYKRQRSHLGKINTIENDVNDLKSDINEIKDLLRELLGKNNR
jgi:hypothetical protein